MIAIYSTDGKTIIDLLTIEEYLELPACTVGEYVTATKL